MADRDRTVWCGNLSSDVTEELLYELFLQAGPLEKVIRPRDRESGDPRHFAFIVYEDEESVPYAVELFRDCELFGNHMRLQAQTPEARAAVEQLARSLRHKQDGYHRDSYEESHRNSPLPGPLPIHQRPNSSNRHGSRSDESRSVPDHLRPSHPRHRRGQRGQGGEEQSGSYDPPYGSRPQRSESSRDGPRPLMDLRPPYGGPRDVINPLMNGKDRRDRDRRDRDRERDDWRDRERDDRRDRDYGGGREWSRRHGRW